MAIRASEGARIEQLHNTRYKPLELTSDNLGIIYLYADHSPQLIKSKHLYLPMYRLDRVRANKNTAEEQMHSGVAILRIFRQRCVIWNCYSLTETPWFVSINQFFKFFFSSGKWKRKYTWQTAPNKCTGQGLQYIK